MRGDPVNARADGRSAFDVGLLVGSGGEKFGQIQRTDCLRLPLPVNMERVVLIVTDDEVGGIEGDRRRRVARAAVGRDLLRAGVRRQAGGDENRQGGLCKCVHRVSPVC